MRLDQNCQATLRSLRLYIPLDLQRYVSGHTQRSLLQVLRQQEIEEQEFETQRKLDLKELADKERRNRLRNAFNEGAKAVGGFFTKLVTRLNNSLKIN